MALTAGLARSTLHISTATCNIDAIILAGWTDPADTQRNVNWTRELFAVWEPYLARAAYVNDLGDEGDDRARSAYGDNYTRLAALKANYDPTNLFRMNQNIKPAAA